MILRSQKTHLLPKSTTKSHVNYPTNLEVYALPSTSLKDRDWKALLELFDREDVDEIEADIQSNLLMLVPEPCWEDDPFDFLSEYL